MADQRVILVPLDDSWVAKAILPYAEMLAKTLKGAIRLLYVAGERSDAAFLDALAADARRRGSSCSITVEHGEPAQRILAAAGQEAVELVIMATHGRGGLERLLVGSVADAVMRACRRPTMLIVPSDFAEAPSVALERLLLPLDGSALAEAALPFAIRLASASGAALSLVQVVEPITASVAPLGYVPNLSEWEQTRTDGALKYLQAVRSRVPEAIASEALVLHALGPARTIASYVQSAGIDLVIMSSRGLGGFRRLVVGSTADQLIRSAVPALLVHPAEPVDGADEEPAEERAANTR